MNRVDVSELTSNEINEIIFKGVEDTAQPVDMPIWIAEQVIHMSWLDINLYNWAWFTMGEYIDDYLSSHSTNLEIF
jgi:hypothetical protein